LRETPLRNYLERTVTEGAIPGGSWWVECDRVPVSRGAVGYAALEPGREGATEDTSYDLASLTKPLSTALVAVILEQERILDLEAPVIDYLPELAGSPYAQVSLLDLGAHRSGLPAWAPLYLSGSSRKEYTTAITRCSPAAGKAATLYSDLSYMLLGFALEAASGETLDRLFELKVAGPLEISDVGFAPGGGRFDGAAPTERGNRYEQALAGEAGAGHRWRAGVIRGEVHDCNAHGLGGVAGHAGLFGTARGVAAICREIMWPERLGLSRAARERLMTPTTASGNRTFGMVTARGSAAARGALPDAAPGHTGFTGTSMWLDPGSECFYILLTNRVHPEVAPGDDFQHVRRKFHELASAR